MNKDTAARALLTMAADTARLLPPDADISAVGIVVQTAQADMPGPIVDAERIAEEQARTKSDEA